MHDNIQDIYNDDLREKKKIAFSSPLKTNKTVFPYDYLSPHEKAKYKKTSKPIITNMYNTILPIREFEKLNEKEQKYRLIYWRNHFTKRKILKEMQISERQFYKFVHQFELPTAPRIKRTLLIQDRHVKKGR